MQTLKIQTTWGKLTLTLKGDQVVLCALPLLTETPREAFSINGFHCLEDLLQTFPNLGQPEGTEFQRAVWRELTTIPRGQTRTYGQIAKAIGRPQAVRAVGSACGANPLPLFIPCHRVTAKNGLGGFGSGLPWKKLLLELEGWSKGVLEQWN